MARKPLRDSKQVCRHVFPVYLVSEQELWTKGQGGSVGGVQDPNQMALFFLFHF